MFVLAIETSPALTPASALISALVAVLALIMAFIALSAARKRGNPALRIVAVAFFLFALKNAFSGFNVVTHAVPHDAIELVLSIFDLGLLVLLFLPLLRRRRS